MGLGVPKHLRKIGKYDLKELLHDGSVYSVYRVVERSTKKTWTMKLVAEDVAERDDIQKIHRELTPFCSKEPKHPNIRHIYDVDKFNGRYYAVYEYLAGVSLDALIDTNKGPMAQPVALQILKEGIDAVAAAHENGVIHGDIRSGNIFMDTGNKKATVKLMNFKRFYNKTHFEIGHLSKEMVRSFAPEILVGKNFSTRSDIYSLGVVFYTLVTGHDPKFDKNGKVPPPSSFNSTLSESIEDMILKMISVKPEDRFTDGAELKKFFESIGLTIKNSNNLYEGIKIIEEKKYLTKQSRIKRMLKQKEKKNRKLMIFFAFLLFIAVISPAFIIKGIKKFMVWNTGMTIVFEGNYAMGCSPGMEKECLKDEALLHNVSLSEYKIDEREVTVKDFKDCVETCKCKKPSAEWDRNNELFRLCNYGDPLKEAHPMNCITWQEASDYCVAIGKRLPTEAEWEVAARSGNIFRAYLNSGKDLSLCDYGNISDKALASEVNGVRSADCDDNFAYTSPVKMYKPNDYGLYDVTGNVKEWVHDWYASNYYYRGIEKNPQGPEVGEARVVRGGGWRSVKKYLRLSYREYYKPDEILPDIGFRCAK